MAQKAPQPQLPISVYCIFVRWYRRRAIAWCDTISRLHTNWHRDSFEQIIHVVLEEILFLANFWDCLPKNPEQFFLLSKSPPRVYPPTTTPQLAFLMHRANWPLPLPTTFLQELLLTAQLIKLNHSKLFIIIQNYQHHCRCTLPMLSPSPYTSIKNEF